jgi:flagellar hook-associated protein 3 FlgL
MRITQRAVALTSLQGLNRNLDSVAKLQQQLTSGKQISAPSDSPTGTNRAMQTRNDQAAVDQQARNITDAQAWLDQTGSTMQSMIAQVQRVRDLTVQGLNTGASSGPSQQARNITDAQAWLDQTGSTIQSMIAQVQRVRDLTVQGMNTGASSGPSQQALATEVASIRDGLIALSNVSVQGRPLFGGVTSTGQAYTTAGAWAGNSGAPVMRRVSDTESIRIDITGPEAFGTAPADLFSVVKDIATDLTANPAALDGHLTALDGVLQGMLAGVADIGSRATRVDGLAQINSDRALSLSSQLAVTEDIDMPETIMRLQMLQVGYQAALAATSKAIQPSLLDYLR